VSYPSIRNVAQFKAIFIDLSPGLGFLMCSADQVQLRRPEGFYYPARSTCYADDLQSFVSSLRGLTFTADVVSAFAI